MKPLSKLWMFLRSTTALALAIAVVGTPAFAQTTGQRVLVKDIAHVQGVTGNQLVGYGIVVGLQGTGDSTSVIFTSQTIQNVLQSFGLSVSQQAVRTRDVAAVIVTATLPPFAHSGDNVDVDVSAMGDASSLQGGTLVLTELRGANNLVYATAQGPVSVGGFVAGFSGSSVNKNYTGAGRIPNGAVIARDMVTPLENQPNGFNYVLTTPDFKTAANLASLLNGHFGATTARALDAETIHVNLPPSYAGNPVQFLADASNLSVSQDELAKVVMNERTGTIVFGGNIKLAPCAIAHGDLTITITTNNQVVQPNPFTTNGGTTALQRNSTIAATEKGKQLTFIAGAATLASVVRALNALGVSPRDLIAIVQALRESGSLQADLEMI
ncbi:MAG TPA: flagellar basal body P-ring protein FlgI [Candidatus Dormibacteraeota bacterium]|nr:flagellar basal body P-ring protein FlgI [Candidatus Dormibacteraeota bacterium]